MSEIALGPYERLDDLQFRGRQMIQDTREFCFSLDAVLLARFVRLGRRDRVLELGTGAGVIPLLVADEAARIEAVEISPRLAALAARNVRLNGLAGNISVRQADWRELKQIFPPESFDHVLANPPYFPLGQGKTNPQAGVARARHEISGTFADLVRAARYALRFGGRFSLVHIPARLSELMGTLHANQLEPKCLRLVAPQSGAAPNLLLLEAVVGAKPGLKMLPELVVREADGSYTEEIKKIYGNAGEGVTH